MEMLQQIQQKELGALEELRRICGRHRLRFYLAQGTLIGAVREKGFIPWDDDIDVIIPYGDLKKLMRIFPFEADEKYMITNHTVEEHYPLSWTKIRINGTRSCPVRYRGIPINWGICIDLFPIFPVSDNALARKAEIAFFKLARKMLLAEMTQYDGKRSAFTRLLEKLPISARHFFADMSIKMLERHGGDTKFVFVGCKGGTVFERGIIFGAERTMLFENNEYPVPSDYDSFLRRQFGDYMVPPPESERGGHDMRMGEIEWEI